MILYMGITALTIALAYAVAGKSAFVSAGKFYGAGAFVRAGKNRAGRAFMSRRRAFDLVCLAALFLILTGLAALRVDVGNDYGKYVETFHEIYAGTDQAYVVTEPGFNFAVKAIYTLCGGENYLLVFALFGAATAFVFLKAMYDQSAWFAGSFALFMLLGLYFRTFTTVRYYFALALALYGLRYAYARQYGKFILVILFAALFHKSVLVVLPLYFLASLPWKRWMVIAGCVLAAGVFLFQEQILNLALTLYPTYQDTVYLTSDVGILANASGILRCLAVFLLAFFCRKEGFPEGGQNRFFLKLNLFGLLLYTCGSFLPLVSRLSYYVITPQILLVPGLIVSLQNPTKKRLVLGAVAFFALIYFAWFLYTAPGGGIRVLPYQSWVFTKKVWINGADFF